METSQNSSNRPDHPARGTYTGGAFDSALPGGRSSGELHVSASEMRFAPSQTGATTGDPHSARPAAAPSSCALPLRGLQVAPGGAAGRLFFFTHPRHPDRSLYTADPDILRDPCLNDVPELRTALARLSRKRAGRWLNLAAALAVLALGIYGLILLKDPVVAMIAARIPVEWEEKLGEVAFAQATAGNRLIENEQVLAGLRQITDPLVLAVNEQSERQYNFQFFIVHDPTLNAFALPGGRVVIHSGLAQAAESPEEIAGVLAHEIAHVTRQHSVRQLISTVGVYLLAQAFVGDMQGLMAVVLEHGSYLLTLKFSRDHERDADLVGLEYLRAANIDPAGMIEVFRKLQAAHEEIQADADDLEMPSFLTTHPDTAERIAELENMLESSEVKKSTYRRFNLDLGKFQKRIAQSL